MKQIIFFTGLTIAVLFTACKQNTAAPEHSVTQEVTVPKSLEERVMTPEQQKALTPDKVLQEFKEGNQRFINNDLTDRDHSAQVRKSAEGQFPKAVVLSCLDSRIPVEDVFDQGIGDVFVARVAGNFVNEDILGSMEFACKVAGAKLVLVMGHQHCGAIKAAIDNVKLGNITAMLSKILPVVEKAQDFEGEKTAKNEAFVKHVCKNNVLHTIDNIRKNSSILNEMEKNGEIKIIGAYYDLTTGELLFLN